MFWNVSEQILNTNNIRWKAHNQAFYKVYNSCIIIAKYKESNLKKQPFEFIKKNKKTKKI